MKTKPKVSGIVTSICLILLPLLSSCASYRQELQYAYTELANKEYEERNYTKSLEWFLKAEKYSSALSIQTKKIELYFLLEKPEEARKALDAALKKDPKNEIVLEYDAYWYLLNSQNQKAIEKYELLLMKNEFDVRNLGNLAVLYGRTNDLDKSIEYFQKAFRISSDNIILIRNYFQVLLSSQEGKGPDTVAADTVATDTVATDTATAADTATVADTAVATDTVADTAKQKDRVTQIHALVEAIESQYQKTLVTSDEVREIANSLLQKDLFDDAYVLYTALLVQEETKKPEKELVEEPLPVQNDKQAETYLRLAEILLARDHTLELKNASAKGLEYLKMSLEGEVKTRSEANKDSLRNILTQVGAPILKERINDLFSQYEISTEALEPRPEEVTPPLAEPPAEPGSEATTPPAEPSPEATTP